MMFINIDVSRAAARSSSAACTARAAGRRLVHGRQKTTGGKVGKVGNPFPGLCSGTKELPVAVARARAISCRIAWDRADAALGGRRPRCLTGVGRAPILPHRKNGLKSRKHKAF
jgi:hypothetical protein